MQYHDGNVLTAYRNTGGPWCYLDLSTLKTCVEINRLLGSDRTDTSNQAFPLLPIIFTLSFAWKASFLLAFMVELESRASIKIILDLYMGIFTKLTNQVRPVLAGRWTIAAILSIALAILLVTSPNSLLDSLGKARPPARTTRIRRKTLASTIWNISRPVLPLALPG